MTMMTVDTNRIDNDRVAVYLASTDRRVTIGVRFALEALGIELPEFLRRGRPGPRRNRANLMMAALDADTGNPNTYRDENLKIGAFSPRRYNTPANSKENQWPRTPALLISPMRLKLLPLTRGQ